jgi:hypothetical protein
MSIQRWGMPLMLSARILMKSPAGVACAAGRFFSDA